jgi:hypothetical protein
VAWMLGGFVVFKVAGALRIDWIGKSVLNAAATMWLFSLLPLGGRRTRHKQELCEVVGVRPALVIR